MAIIKKQLKKIDYIILGVIVAIASCTNNENPRNTDALLKADTVDTQKFETKPAEKKHVQLYDTLIKVLKDTSINETTKVFVTNEYKMPKSGKLKFDSTFYQIGTFINIDFENESLKDYKFDIGNKTGTPRNIRIWDCPFETSYNWFLASSMTIESDMLETCLIGFTDNAARLIAQEVWMNLDEIIIKDSTLIFLQEYGEPVEGGSEISIDSVRINIYSGQRSEFDILDTVEYYK